MIATDRLAAEFDAGSRDGYFVARDLFTPEEVAEIRETFMEMNANGPVEGLSEIVGGRGEYTPDDPLRFYPRMMQPHFHPELPVGPVAKKYMLDPRLRPYLRAFMGDEPVAVQSMFYFKPPMARGQELHQDNYYLRVKPGTCMAAWLAIDDADFENGGMKVVPGSQDLEIACPSQADASISFTTDFVAPPEGMSAVHVDLKAGDVLFFNGSIIHGSSPNSSATRFRRSLIFHYVPLSSEEVGKWYGIAMETFDGDKVEIQGATGSGPCGTAQPMRPH
ncbi:phytanoyl-CoA dioxygenase family protein [Fimbriimonas ginsengisoli]|nr:phytanoyl-CoA dioxygenase family protein [Fimbriimonas ginsengisoli]